MKNLTLKEGLRKTPPDERDFQFGAINKPVSLPEQFRLKTLGVKDQGSTDYCTAYASCLASETQEGIELAPEWSFAVSKMISGDLNAFGQDIRTACKAHTDHGALPKLKSPYSLENKEESFLRDIKNWPDLFITAITQKKKSYFKITGSGDHFENIKQAIYRTKTPVISGVLWHWDISDKILAGISSSGVGHAIAFIGWEGDYLVVQNSFGREAGEDGCHLMPREVVNYYVSDYGAYTFVDLTKEEVQYYLTHQIKLGQIDILTKVVKLLRNLISYINANKIIQGFGQILAGIFSKRN